MSAGVSRQIEKNIYIDICMYECGAIIDTNTKPIIDCHRQVAGDKRVVQGGYRCKSRNGMGGE